MSKVAKRYTFAGLPIAVENPAGSERVWPGDGGVERKAVMRNDYGFIDGTEGTDGDEIDVYIGPDPNARFAFVVRQLERPGYDKHDEDKVFLGFDSEAAARACFVAHRDDGDRAYGGMTSISIGDFVRKIESRVGAGRIRYEQNPHELATVLMEQRGLFELTIGRSLMFDSARSAGGAVAAGVWDRGFTPGEKIKDGQLSSFTPEAFDTFASNWLRRGEKISLCYNHQSAYVATNGQPAPSLASYDAVAIVLGEQVVRFERLHASPALSAPSVFDLKNRVAALATDLEPNPSIDGMWFYRAEVTPLGQELLPNYSYISPMFTMTGKDELGRDQGPTIIDLAATNTAFQAGCVISFERASRPSPTKGVTKMATKLSKMSKFVKFDAEADDKTVKAAVMQKFEEEKKAALEGDDAYNFEEAAARLEEMAKGYEDAAMEDDGDDKPHVAMRQCAAKFRRMGVPKLEGGEPDKKPKDDEGKKEEAFERTKLAELRPVAARLGISGAERMTSKQIFDAIEATAVPTSKIGELVTRGVAEALKKEKERESAEVYAARADELVTMAVGMPDNQKAAIKRLAQDPQHFEAARGMVGDFLKSTGAVTPDTTQLFSRMTGAGAPLGLPPAAARSAAGAAGSDARIVAMDVLGQGGRALVSGEKLSAATKALADSTDPTTAAKVDRELEAGMKGTQFESFGRYQAAERILKKEQPTLFEAAKTDQIRLF